MSRHRFVERIRAVLEPFPEVELVADGETIRFVSAKEDGFDVTMIQDQSRFLVYYNGWQQEFESENEALSCFFRGLTKRVRLAEERRGGKAYKWTLENRQGNDWWSDSTASLSFAPFWKRKKTVYLQNDLPLAAEL